MIRIFLQSMLIGYSGAIMPGSLLTYTLDRSIRIGAKAGFLISVGHALLEFLLVVLLFLGAGRYLQMPLAQIIIGGVGGAVLIFFGAGMIKDALRGKLNINIESGLEGKKGGMILSSAVISASNPYFAIWWAAVGLGLMMNAYSVMGIMGIAVFYVGHIAADFSWYMLVSFLTAKTRHFINLKVYKIIIMILGAVLIAFALKSIYSSVEILIGIL